MKQPLYKRSRDVQKGLTKNEVETVQKVRADNTRQPITDCNRMFSQPKDADIECEVDRSVQTLL